MDLESVVFEMNQDIGKLTAKVDNVMELLIKSIKSSNSIGRLDERVKTANNRIQDLELESKNQQKEISAIKVKYATIATVISLAGSFLYNVVIK